MTLKDLTGQSLGQYELRELIGTGGMGAVYRGYQTSLQRAVAVKVLSTALAEEPGYLERFYREAKTAALLEHAHIVPVYDYGIQRELSYVVMRLLTGGTLADRMQRRANTNQPLPSPGEIATLLRQVASALDYAHSQGVIHRDIKPSNIMFDNQGNSYLVDFGIAKLLSATSALTGTGTTMGTPAFMPPEQWRSEDLTPSADQYALGVTAYMLLTGRTPYEATTPFGLMHKHLNETPTPAHVQRPDLPPDVTVVLERALAKVPADRFPSVTAFAQAFEGAIAGHTGPQTGFFTTTLPRSTPSPTKTTLPPDQAPTPPLSEDVPTFTPTPSLPTPQGQIVSAPKMTTRERASEQVSMPVQLQPTGSRRSPVIWILAAALVIALGVIGVLVLDGGKEKKATPTPGPVVVESTATETAAPTTAAPVIAVVPSATATSAPTKTSTPEPSPTRTPRPTDTATAIPTPTRTPRPTHTVTAVPTATRTPRPSDTPVSVAQVEIVDMAPGTVMVFGSSSSQVHVTPSDTSPVIAVVVNQSLPVTGLTADKLWFRVEIGGQPGWVREVPDVATLASAAAAPADVVAVIGVNGGVILRRAPHFDAEAGPNVSNVRLTITGRTADGTWLHVEYLGQPWWMRRSAFVRIEGDLDSVPVVGEEAVAAPADVVAVVGVNGGAILRRAPRFDAEAGPTVSDARLTITGRTADGTWLHVEYLGQPWWMRRSAFVRIEGDLDRVPVVEEAAAVESVTYTTVVRGPIASLDPQRVTPEDSGAAELDEQLFMGLTALDPEHPGNLLPRLAERWEVSDDLLTWTFHLRPDVPWVTWNADQKQVQVWRNVTAADFSYAIRRACDPRLGNWYNYVLTEVIDGCADLAGIAPGQVRGIDYDLVKVSAPDATTLIVHLTAPASHFLSLTTLPLLRPVPAELIDQFGDDWIAAGHIATNGAYALAGTTENRYALVRNPALPGDLRGPGNVDGVLVFSADNLARVLDLFRGQQVDSATFTSQERGETSSSSAIIQAARPIPAQAVIYLGLTYDKPPFDDVRVRRAFSYAIDRQALIDAAIPHQAIPFGHLIPPGNVGAPPQEFAGASYDPDLARKLLAEAGYPDCAGLPPITLATRNNAQGWAEVMIKFLGDTLGCPASLFTVRSYSFDDLNNLLATGSAADRPNLWIAGWVADYPDAHNWVLEPLGCGMANPMRRPCADVDHLIDAADHEPDLDARRKMYLDIELQFFGPEGEHPIIPLALRTNYVLAQPWISGPLDTDGLSGGRHYDWIVVDMQAKPDGS